MRATSLLLLGCLTAFARGQELLWTVHSLSGTDNVACMPSFGDYDGDGAEDLLVYALGSGGSSFDARLRVLSGANGALLAELSVPFADIRFITGVGDFDLDGHPDVAFRRQGAFSIEVWSIAGKRLLFLVPNTVNASYAGLFLGNGDLSGDGLPDLIYSRPDGQIDVFHSSGVLYYSIPALALGFAPRSLAGVGDLDGDGVADFVVGATEGITGLALGSVILVSGATGVPLRVHLGPYPGAWLNRDVRAAGDVDGDGVMDYAGGNSGGMGGLVMIWSGATGALIRQWHDADPRFLFGEFLAGIDVDLDGRPDVIDFAAGYPSPTGQPGGWGGRVLTLSSRDGQQLVDVPSLQYTVWWGRYYANLGVQPGNPYPVFVLMDNPAGPPFPQWARIRAYRCSPAGTRFVGSGCTNTSTVPTIGIRRVDAGPTDHGRLVLGSAPTDAFAVCVAAPTSLALATPVPLDFLGLPGCDLLVAPAITELRVTGASGMDRGYAAFDFPSAMVPTGGVEFAAQWVVLDVSNLQYATTARYEFRVQ